MNQEMLFKRIDQDIGEFILKINRKESRRRMILYIHPKEILHITKYILEELECRFVTATIMQEGERIEIFYHFSQDENGQVISIHVELPLEDPKIESLSNLTHATNWIEREMHELYGVEFINHPKMEPLISEGNWEKDEFPYRKDST